MADSDPQNQNPADEKGDSEDPFAEVTSNPIGRIGLALLKDYINHGLDKKHISNVPKLDGLGTENKLSAEELKTCKSIGLQLQKIGDTFHKDESLQRQINCLSSEMPKIETIMTVANVIFGDTKNLNWGRIVALFYFALEMCVRAIKYMTKDGILVWIKDLIVQVAVFIVRRFGNWITQQGGWNALVDHYSHPNPALVTVIAIAAVVGIYFIYMSRRK